ncbi:hypothetical protein NNO_1512 [Hydrogenimonas sp.]|nr:hypothetical protein NNO_1512 [Hydrogenimonas sp.]
MSAINRGDRFRSIIDFFSKVPSSHQKHWLDKFWFLKLLELEEVEILLGSHRSPFLEAMKEMQMDFVSLVKFMAQIERDEKAWSSMTDKRRYILLKFRKYLTAKYRNGTITKDA